MNMKIKGIKSFSEGKSFIFSLKTILMMGKFFFLFHVSFHSSASLKVHQRFLPSFLSNFFFAPSPISFILARNLENKSRTINFEGKRSWKVLRLSLLPSLCLGFECQNPHSRSENFSFSNFLFFSKKVFLYYAFFYPVL